jgi:hypothetical protein
VKLVDAWRSRREGKKQAQDIDTDWSIVGDAVREAPVPLNRKQRRDYVRQVTPRQARINIVGFGMWRKPQRNKERIANLREMRRG